MKLSCEEEKGQGAGEKNDLSGCVSTLPSGTGWVSLRRERKVCDARL